MTFFFLAENQPTIWMKLISIFSSARRNIFIFRSHRPHSLKLKYFLEKEIIFVASKTYNNNIETWNYDFDCRVLSWKLKICACAKIFRTKLLTGIKTRFSSWFSWVSKQKKMKKEKIRRRRRRKPSQRINYLRGFLHLSSFIKQLWLLHHKKSYRSWSEKVLIFETSFQHMLTIISLTLHRPPVFTAEMLQIN